MATVRGITTSKTGKQALTAYQAGQTGIKPAATPAATPAPPASPAAPAQTDSAFQSILAALTDKGLGAFANLAWNDYKNNRDDINLIVADIRSSGNLYDSVFGKGAGDLIKSGIYANEGAITSYHNTIKQSFSYYGIPDSVANTYLTGDNLNKLALDSVSPQEIDARLKIAQQAATASINPAQRAELQRVTGITTGDLTAYWLDPSIGLSDAQNRFTAAQIGGAGDLAGYGQIDVGKLLDLAGQGVTQNQAQQGFSTLAGEQQLFTALPGESGQGIGQDAQLSAAFGSDATAQAAIERARRQRIGQFTGGGAAAASQTGAVGLGQNVT